VVNNRERLPATLALRLAHRQHWIKVRTIGTKSNRSGIGARLKCVTKITGESKPHEQIDEVRSGGGYFSPKRLAGSLRLGKAEKVELLEVRWPCGLIDTLKDIKPNQLIFVKEGQGIVRSTKFDVAKPTRR